MTERRSATQVQDAFWHCAEHVLFHHTNPWELDEALVAAGFAMGPCEAQDLVGLDKVLSRAPDRPGPVLRRMVAEGRMGKGGGVGFYRYPGGGGAVIDPLIEDLILEEAWFAKLSRSELPDAALVDMMSAPVRSSLADLQRSGQTQAQALDLIGAALHLPASKARRLLRL